VEVRVATMPRRDAETHLVPPAGIEPAHMASESKSQRRTHGVRPGAMRLFARNILLSAHQSPMSRKSGLVTPG